MKKKVKQSKQKHLHPDAKLFYLVVLLLLILASIAIIQQPQEIRNKAQEQTPAPTPLLRCDVPCSYNSQCPDSLFCFQGVCRNPSCPNASDCTCLLTPTPGFSSSSTPKPLPTKTPTSTVRPTPTPESTSVPTIIPTPTFTAPFNEQPKNISLLEAIIHFIGTMFCKLFRLC